MKCYYCNSQADDTEEHIPPKSLYKGSNPWLNKLAMGSCLLKVPSCVRHNRDTSTDDDLFVYLVADIACANHFAANVITAQACQLASMFKGDFSRFKERMMLLNCTPLHGESRLFDTRKVTRDDKLALMRREAIKIYRGIYYCLHSVAYQEADDQLADEWFFLVESGELERLQNMLEGCLTHISPPKLIVSGDAAVFTAEYYNGGSLKLVLYEQIACLVRPTKNS